MNKAKERLCERCGYVRPDVRWADDYEQYMCDECWAHTLPRENRPPRWDDPDESEAAGA